MSGVTHPTTIRVHLFMTVYNYSYIILNPSYLLEVILVKQQACPTQWRLIMKYILGIKQRIVLSASLTMKFPPLCQLNYVTWICSEYASWF